MPVIRMVTLPASTYYRARGNLAEVRPIAATAFPEIIDDLIRPLTAEEAKPPQITKEVQSDTIKVSGADYEDAAEKLNQLFLDNRWADGLPIVPPTAKAVKAMLAGTSRRPDEVIGQVAPKKGIATVEKIAINAVMAGAKPEYLPVIITAMEGLTDPHYDLTHVQASTGSFTPMIVVDGPIAKELNFNAGIGLLGHGFRANSTVGRALRLSLLNLGLTWPAVNDMALIGREESYTFFTFAENQDFSPWEPYDVDLGFKPEDSTVTVATTFDPVAVGGGAVAPWTAQGILDTVVSRMSTVGFGWFYSQTYTVVFHPDCATELAKMGFTRKSLREWLYEHSRVPYDKLPSPIVKAAPAMIDDGRIRPDRQQLFKDALKAGGKVPVVQSPEDIHIFVAGGSPGYSLLFSYPGPNWAYQTKKITGATLTKAGR